MPTPSHFQKSRAKKVYDTLQPGFIEDERKQKEAELSKVIDKSRGILTEDEVKRMKIILSKLSSGLLDELQATLINKQLSDFKKREVLHETDDRQ